SKELQSFTGNNPLTGTALSSMVMPSAPPVSKSRYYFNNAHGATINTLKKWKNDNEFTFNLIGLQDMDERSSFSRTTFIFPESDTLSVNEKLSSETKTNKIEGELGYLKNVKENYVYAYYGSLNSYYSKYTIRPSSILLKARFKIY
ncbi:MAG: hypothetical protein K9I47_02270, partial [Bacteroidales bacterium]|nr:hypothetical protein [Bacteroidales bacterium]